jgi:hypothetical protein
MIFESIFLNNCTIVLSDQLSPLTTPQQLSDLSFMCEFSEGRGREGELILTSDAEIDIFRSEIELCLPIQTKTSPPQSNKKHLSVSSIFLSNESVPVWHSLPWVVILLIRIHSGISQGHTVTCERNTVDRHAQTLAKLAII